MFLAHQIRKSLVLVWNRNYPGVLTQANYINALQFFGGVVQEKEFNMGFCCRWALPTQGMTVLSRTSVYPRFHSAQSSLGLETPIFNRTSYQILIVLFLISFQKLKECFESKDISKLQKAIVEMPKEEAEYHMKRCVDSGLWVPNAADAGATGGGEEGEGGLEEEVYDEVEGEK